MPRKGKYTVDRQEKIMEFLSKYQEENTYAPSIREIGDYIGVNSTSLVDYYLRQLIAKGYLERNEHVSRSLRVVKPYTNSSGVVTASAAVKRQEVLRFPIVGQIVASAPIPVPGSDFAYYDEESYVEVPRKMLPPNENVNDLFVLEVSGDSMIDAMINDGDRVIFRKTAEANNGDMVAIWLPDNEETTLKYFYDEGKQIRLQPANPTMGPIYVNKSRRPRIMGKVVMVIRHL